ncbi:MAG: hypothetical protein LLF96_10625 [Eubacteriales bacterium]|nr:hypothetical protein [Eubacteriales bacterium]
MATDWLKLQEEYLHTPVSLRRLAKKHGIGCTTISNRAAREGWAAQKRTAKPNPPEPAVSSETASGTTPTCEMPLTGDVTHPCDVPPACDADRLAQLQAIGDQLTAQLARAVSDLDKQAVQHKRRTKEIIYGDQEAKGKPVEETTEEKVLSETIRVPVSSIGLHRLSTALKILREVTLADNGDMQSLKLVADLMKKLDAEAGKEAE